MSYVHGYDARESLRLTDQASALSTLLHAGTTYPPGSSILEAGCGVGAQTVVLAKNSPGAFVTSVDVSEASIALARARVKAAGIENVTFAIADIFDLPFEADTFDHIFVCFVLEHLSRPAEALRGLRRYLKPGGSLTAIEGDHGSAYFHPDSAFARKAIEAQVALQARAGGNACIGRALYPLLIEAGYASVAVSLRQVYVDASRPELVEDFTKKTFAAMIRGVRAAAIDASFANAADFDRGVEDLERCAEADGVFCYTFFKAVASEQTA